jgi:acyl-CoA thioester hydrolase
LERSELDPEVARLLEGYPVVVTTMVGWGDMDANAHVNNTMYFRYIEHARLHYFRVLGFSRAQQNSGIGPILAWADCRFRRPLAYPDTVSIGTRVVEIGDDRFTMEAVIVSHVLKDVAATGNQKLVSYDYRQNQKAPLPPGIRQRIEEVEREARPDVKF